MFEASTLQNSSRLLQQRKMLLQQLPALREPEALYGAVKYTLQMEFKVVYSTYILYTNHLEVKLKSQRNMLVTL
jgi:hypothetical protein